MVKIEDLHVIEGSQMWYTAVFKSGRRKYRAVSYWGRAVHTLSGNIKKVYPIYRNNSMASKHFGEKHEGKKGKVMKEVLVPW